MLKLQNENLRQEIKELNEEIQRLNNDNQF